MSATAHDLKWVADAADKIEDVLNEMNCEAAGTLTIKYQYGDYGAAKVKFAKTEEGGNLALILEVK